MITCFFGFKGKPFFLNSKDFCLKNLLFRFIISHIAIAYFTPNIYLFI